MFYYFVWEMIFPNQVSISSMFFWAFFFVRNLGAKPNVTRKKLPKWHSYEKREQKTLMKLTTEHNIRSKLFCLFSDAIFVRIVLILEISWTSNFKNQVSSSKMQFKAKKKNTCIKVKLSLLQIYVYFVVISYVYCRAVNFNLFWSLGTLMWRENKRLRVTQTVQFIDGI